MIIDRRSLSVWLFIVPCRRHPAPVGRWRPTIRRIAWITFRCEAVRFTPEPDRQRFDRPLIRARTGPLSGHLRRDAAGGQAAPIDLAGGQDVGPIHRQTTDLGRGIEGVVGDGVACDRRDHRGAASSAPEPTRIVWRLPVRSGRRHRGGTADAGAAARQHAGGAPPMARRDETGRPP